MSKQKPKPPHTLPFYERMDALYLRAQDKGRDNWMSRRTWVETAEMLADKCEECTREEKEEWFGRMDQQTVDQILYAVKNKPRNYPKLVALLEM